MHMLHRRVKLVVVAGQRFLTAVVNDAMQLARRKAAAQPSRGRAKDQDRRMVLTPEDAAQALREVRGHYEHQYSGCCCFCEEEEEEEERLRGGAWLP